MEVGLYGGSALCFGGCCDLKREICNFVVRMNGRSERSYGRMQN